MRDWPPIAEPELLQRLALDDEQFAALPGLWLTLSRTSAVRPLATTQEEQS